MDIIKKSECSGSVVLRTFDSPAQSTVSAANDNDVRIRSHFPNRPVNLQNRTTTSSSAVNNNDRCVIQIQGRAECLNIGCSGGQKLLPYRHRNTLNPPGRNPGRR